jgi:hypothetical protein
MNGGELNMVKGKYSNILEKDKKGSASDRNTEFKRETFVF